MIQYICTLKNITLFLNYSGTHETRTKIKKGLVLNYFINLLIFLFLIYNLLQLIITNMTNVTLKT